MSTLVGALLLSRSIADAELAQKILDVTRDHSCNQTET
jgi:TetR/AcrR family transcriptional repressor of nem operon